MSRTDKTKPYWVKLMHGDLTHEEVHDHTDSVCDLPPIQDAVAFTYGTTQCHRVGVYTGTRSCCCPMCHCYEWPMSEPQRRRRERRVEKQQLKDWRRHV